MSPPIRAWLFAGLARKGPYRTTILPCRGVSSVIGCEKLFLEPKKATRNNSGANLDY
jgi:hypothetical protein